jgi:hypothetical protein
MHERIALAGRLERQFAAVTVLYVRTMDTNGGELAISVG